MLEIRHIRYRYPGAARPALGPLELRVAPGEMVLVTGETGCGKTTLLRACAGLLQRHGQGELGGEVRVNGEDPGAMSPARRVRRIGYVSQEPSDQLVTGTLGDEVAFAPESAAWDPARIRACVPDRLRALGLPVEPDRRTRSLSGGQQQRLAVAAALAAGAELLLLDEPLAQLDPQGARELVRLLARLAQSGRAVVVVEHRLEPCLEVVSRVVVLEGGRMVADMAGGATDGAALRDLAERGLSVPEDLLLQAEIEEEGTRWADLVEAASKGVGPGGSRPSSEGGRLLVHGEHLAHRYEESAAPALDDVEFEARAGERVALLGGNGAGKSTLLAVLAGQLRGGRLERHGTVVDVPQNPDLALFSDTVRAELAYGPREAGLSPHEVEARVTRTARALALEPLLSRPPQGLSRGQRLRVAVGAALACRPALLLLDEPTSGQDRGRVDLLMASLAGEMAEGALVFATHDVGMVLRHATRAVALASGRVVAQGPPGVVLAGIEAEAGPLSALVLPALPRRCVRAGLPPLDRRALREAVRRGETGANGSEP